jgi:pimeloyl-ACP methyl ester carboxylesterase
MADRTPYTLVDMADDTAGLLDADDPLIQVDGGRATAGAVPGARLVVFPGMGHDLPQQLWPQLVEEIVTHATSVQPGGATRA